MRFDHVKIMARDVQLLADFYREALGCEPVSPVMELCDPALMSGLGVTDTAIRMIWLRMPGQNESGAGLELYQIVDDSAAEQWGYRPGQGQLSFRVDDVESAVEKVIDAGGEPLGRAVEWDAPSGNTARFVYLRDPEGNVIDLWSPVAM